jgi:hypothetical protein
MALEDAIDKLWEGSVMTEEWHRDFNNSAAMTKLAATTLASLKVIAAHVDRLSEEIPPEGN